MYERGAVMADEIKKKRGRPPLSPEIKAERIALKNASTNAYHKKNGYAAQEKYRQAHPEKYRAYRETARGRTYEPKLRIPIEKKDELASLLQSEGVSLTQMFVTLVMEKYGINLSSENADN